ncbi:MAG: hypothetical protein H8D63_02935 [Parcubacteria group bacterium]|nr:hypothetical protein [Parcubacteria group bacterium]
MNNNAYNIMRQLVQEYTSLWRIKDDYLADAGDTPELEALWKEVASEKEDNIEKLTEELKKII